MAIRGNFCTLDAAGNISDRRAGRIASEESTPLAIRLREAKVPGIEVFRRAGERASLRRRAARRRLEGRRARHRSANHRRAAAGSGRTRSGKRTNGRGGDANSSPKPGELLAGEKKANGVTLRGFSAKPKLPSYEEVYGLRAAAIAVYPMYKGLARLVGMQIVGQAQTLAEQVAVLREHWNDFDFFFLHFKYTDSTGEDGSFDAKVKRIEELDAAMPEITALKPTVLIVTGDHSTPSFLKSHSWHPVPTLLVSDCCRADGCQKFGESEALRGGLGQFEAKYLMLLALANAGRLAKYGA